MRGSVWQPFTSIAQALLPGFTISSVGGSFSGSLLVSSYGRSNGFLPSLRGGLVPLSGCKLYSTRVAVPTYTYGTQMEYTVTNMNGNPDG